MLEKDSIQLHKKSAVYDPVRYRQIKSAFFNVVLLHLASSFSYAESLAEVSQGESNKVSTFKSIHKVIYSINLSTACTVEQPCSKSVTGIIEQAIWAKITVQLILSPELNI